jgi:hypothetical protein
VKEKLLSDERGRTEKVDPGRNKKILGREGRAS